LTPEERQSEVEWLVVKPPEGGMYGDSRAFDGYGLGGPDIVLASEDA
jgi:hypothetical protein